MRKGENDNIFIRIVDYMDLPELWISLLENPPYLLITVGFVFLMFWLVNSVANIVVDPAKKKIMPFLSLFFLIIGFTWLLLPPFWDIIYPSNLTVHGKIMDQYGKPIVSAKIEIPGLPIHTTDVTGYYNIENVPNSKNYLYLTVPGKEQYYEPCEINFREKKVINNSILYDYILESKSFTISGEVYDENDNLTNAIIEIDNRKIDTNDYGYYEMTGIPCTAKNLKVIKSGMERFSSRIEFLPSEKKTYRKKINIYLASEHEVNIYGNISYTDKRGRIVEPVSNAKIKVGGLSGTTDENGKYEILNVPRNATRYSVAINGHTIDDGKLNTKPMSHFCKFKRECENDIKILFDKKPA